MKELLEWIELQDERLIETHRDATKSERILSRTVKLGEEFGELCDDVLSASKDQRKEKLEKLKEDNLSGEFADVIITTLLLAKSMDVDIKKALEKKIEKINKRYA